jgi:hypothetical protein
MAAPTVLAVAGLAAAGIAAFSAVQQGQLAGDAAKVAADQAERNAELARQNAGFEERRLRERLALVQGSQVAAAASQGLLATGGSPLEVMARTAEDAEIDILAIQRAGEVAAQRQIAQAAISRLEGRAARSAGGFRAGASLLTGSSSAVSILGTPGEP